MSDLVAISYDSVATATEVAGNVLEAQKAHTIELDDLVVVERLLSEIKNPGKVIQSSLDNETEERLSTALASARG
jgi:uncharacterized membrane protein